jgi:hypothetical protein
MTSDTVSPRVRDAVVVLLWAPVVLILLGIGIGGFVALVGVGYSLATSGRVPDLGGLAGAVDPTLVAVAILGAIGYLYLILANETFGTETVEAAQEQAEDIKGEVEDEGDDAVEGAVE